MALTRNGKPADSCSACGHTTGVHSNEACEAIRCDCRVTRKQLAAGGESLLTTTVATTVVPVFTPSEISHDRAPNVETKLPASPEKPRRARRDRSDGTHAA